jgi:hypothetical protein
MAQRHTGAHERFLEGEGAADGEGNQVVAPIGHDGFRLVYQLAVAPDAVARNIGGEIEVFAQFGERAAAGLRHAKHRTGLRIALGEAEEMGGERLRQNDQIGLYEAERNACRVARQLAPAGSEARSSPVGVSSCFVR